MSKITTEEAAAKIQGAWRCFQARKVLASNRKDITTRKHAAIEIRTTEESYCRVLDLIIERYLLPCRDLKILSKKNLNLIFANIEDIRGINKDFLEKLGQCMENWTNQTLIGPILSKIVPSLRLYKIYCANYNTALTKLEEKRENNAKFAAFLERTTLEIGVNMPLQAYLIQPVQRIPRYRLLFNELLKNTPPNHVDYEVIKQSLEFVADIAVLVNESIREAEHMNSLVELKKKFSGDVPDLIKPKRFLVKEGPLMKVCRKEAKPRQFFLLNDLLIYATAVLAPTATGAQYRFHRALPLEFTSAVDIPDKSTAKNAFQFLSKTKSFEVYAETPEEKAQWLNGFHNAKEVLFSNSGRAAEVTVPEIAPVWAPDKDSKVCMLCQVKFTTLNRRHHCRNCGTLCCGDCSAHKAYLPNIGKTCRVCYSCFETVTGRSPTNKAHKGALLTRKATSSVLKSSSNLSDAAQAVAAGGSSSSSSMSRSPSSLHGPPLSNPPPLDTSDEEFSSGSDFVDSDDELWEPPSKLPPPIPV